MTQRGRDGWQERCCRHGVVVGLVAVMALAGAGVPAGASGAVEVAGVAASTPHGAAVTAQPRGPEGAALADPAGSILHPGAAMQETVAALAPPRVERWRVVATWAARVVREREGVALDPDLLLALVDTESSGDPAASSAEGAVGLAQVRPIAFADVLARQPTLFPRRDLLDPSENVLAGALYLVLCARYLGVDLADEDGLRQALHAYNMGPAAARALPRSLPLETRLHAERTLGAYAAARAARAPGEQAAGHQRSG